jgi:predicted RNA-binding protein YlqC (UPF0109 family)
MKDLIKHIAQAVVDRPKAVEVSEVEGEQCAKEKGRCRKNSVCELSLIT